MQDTGFHIIGTFHLGIDPVLCRIVHEQNNRFGNHPNHSVDIFHTDRCVTQKHEHNELSELTEILLDRVQQSRSHFRNDRNEEKPANLA